MKKNVILVNSLFNIILAIQVRRKMFADEYFDVVLSDESSGLKEIYDSGKLTTVFNNVYYVDHTGIVGRKNYFVRSAALKQPQKGVAALLKEKIKLDYTDIFFWNPDAMFYYMIMQEKKDNIDFRLHLYCDAATNYYKAMPGDAASVIFDLYKPSKHAFLREKYGVGFVRELEFDDYLFSPQYATMNGHRKLVQIPFITRDEETLEIYNAIFTVTLKDIDKYKYLFFAQPICDYLEDTSEYEKMIRSLVEKVGSDKVVVKMHPRCNNVDKDIYEKYGINMISDSSPWEMYCMNNDTEGQVFISLSSGAGIMPHILFGQDNRAIMLYDAMKVPFEKVGDIRPFYDKFGDYLDIPSNVDEFLAIIDDIENN